MICFSSQSLLQNEARVSSFASIALLISARSVEVVLLAGRKKANGHKVVLNGSDEYGRVLQGQDAVFENSKQWHDTAFPSYLQSKKDDFCLNWEEAMQVFLAHYSLGTHRTYSGEGERYQCQEEIELSMKLNRDHVLKMYCLRGLRT